MYCNGAEEKVAEVKSADVKDLSEKDFELFRENLAKRVGMFFPCLLQFLKKQEAILEELEQLELSLEEGSSSAKVMSENPGKVVKKAFSKATSGQRVAQSKSWLDSCTACADGTHAGRLFVCKVFRKMDLHTRKAHLKSHGGSHRCLCFHSKDGRCNPKFLCAKTDCRKEEPHYYLLYLKNAEKAAAAKTWQ